MCRWAHTPRPAHNGVFAFHDKVLHFKDGHIIVVKKVDAYPTSCANTLSILNNFRIMRAPAGYPP